MDAWRLGKRTDVRQAVICVEKGAAPEPWTKTPTCARASGKAGVALTRHYLAVMEISHA